MHLLQQLRDGFKPQILPAALTLQKILGLSTHFHSYELFAWPTLTPPPSEFAF